MDKLRLLGSMGILLLVLSGCSQTPVKESKPHHTIFSSDEEEGDGPPLHYVDISKIQNAVPKPEPLSRYGNPRSYVVFGKQYYVMSSSKGYEQTGTASWYGRKFHGRRTSSGEPYDVYQMTAAHKTLPLPTYAKVKNLKNGKEIIVKINDRGPFVGDRIIDLSYAAAKKLGLDGHGTSRVTVTALDPKHLGPHTHPVQVAKASIPARKPMPTLAKAPAHKKPIPTLAKNEKFFVQLGSFKDKANATQLAKRTSNYTKNMKFLDIYVHEAMKAQARLYSVRVGPFNNSNEAEQLKTKLAQASLSAPQIVKESVP